MVPTPPIQEKSDSVRLSGFNGHNPFRTPSEANSAVSRPVSLRSIATSYALSHATRPPKQRKFRSARLTEEYEKPWLAKRDVRETWDTILFVSFIVLGLGLGAYIIWTGWTSVENPDYCLVMEDDFNNGINPDNWSFEMQVDGFGAHSFDWTTNASSNAYTDAAGLHIVPTLTTETTDITNAQILNGYRLNLTSLGECTGTGNASCAKFSNSTAGTIINPVRSARLNTKGKHNIRFGKIEVRAKLPRGDWLWPAIWMMPENSVYGEWPASGEIDIMESKGNPSSYDGGRNSVASTLHWGPLPSLDSFWRTSSSRSVKRKDYSDDFHTYGMEWSENYIFTYVDSRLTQTFYVPFGQKYGSFYERGSFGSMNVNGTVPPNSWASSNLPYTAPFDQAFYLILNVAVGSSSGYFADGYGNKPWVDGSQTAMMQFWSAKDAWLPTWGAGDTRGMTVRSVKMYKRCGKSAEN